LLGLLFFVCSLALCHLSHPAQPLGRRPPPAMHLELVDRLKDSGPSPDTGVATSHVLADDNDARALAAAAGQLHRLGWLAGALSPRALVSPQPAPTRSLPLPLVILQRLHSLLSEAADA
jgi:hypothetical protein